MTTHPTQKLAQGGETAKHTPTPWFAVRNESYWQISPYDDKYAPSIGDCCGSRANWGADVELANAAFICKAVNNYEKLVEALEKIIAVHPMTTADNDDLWMTVGEHRKIALAALAPSPHA